MGEAADEVHGELLHTIGNLTLTGYNEKYSNRSFREKKAMEEGFNTSQLQLNRFMRERDDWDRHSIQDRASQLAETALEIWPRPAVEQAEAVELEERERKTGTREPTYLANLKAPHINELYQLLRDRMLQSIGAMAVRETIYYIGFRTDQMLVKVVPKQDRVEVALNIPYDELDDPANMCRDGGAAGQWRYWSILNYSDASQLDVIMKLVEQVVEQSAKSAEPVANPDDGDDAEFDNHRAVALGSSEQVEDNVESSSVQQETPKERRHRELLKALIRDISGLDAGTYDKKTKYYSRIHFCGSELYVWPRKDHLMLVLMVGEQVLFDPNGRWARIETKSGFRTVERRFRFDNVNQLPYIMNTLREVAGM